MGRILRRMSHIGQSDNRRLSKFILKITLKALTKPKAMIN